MVLSKDNYYLIRVLTRRMTSPRDLKLRKHINIMQRENEFLQDSRPGLRETAFITHRRSGKVQVINHFSKGWSRNKLNTLAQKHCH